MNLLFVVDDVVGRRVMVCCCRVLDSFICTKDQSFPTQLPVCSTAETTSSGFVDIDLNVSTLVAGLGPNLQNFVK